MSVEHSILGVISLYPCSGYDMKVEFEIGGAGLLSALSFGSIYPRLKQMEQDGLIETSQVSGEGRRKKVYELTARGWKELEKWLKELSAYPIPMNDELLLKMVFWAAGRPEDRATLIDHLQMRWQQSKEMREYLIQWPQNGTSLISEYGMLAIRYVRARLETELAWIEETITQLEGPPQGPVQDPRHLAEQQRERRARAFAEQQPQEDGEQEDAE
ncbi:MAG: PadR family transcriptional regulator [Ktedonobacteraceae bacterium]|nr:PadR family transcriptional regulator [Ktedonobacteraceae bacterium]